MNEHFWGTVKVLLKNKGMTQVEFSKSLDIAVRTFQDWSTSKRLPDVETCYKIASALGVTIDYLLRTEGKDYTILREDQERLLGLYEQIPSQFKNIAFNTLEALLPLRDKV